MKKLILFGVKRHAIAVNDFYMFFTRTGHSIEHIFFPADQTKNRDWWDLGHRTDKARDSIIDPIDKKKYSITEWTEINRVVETLKAIEWDLCLMGNGNDPAQKILIKEFGRERFIFSEYGWLPWSEHFYLARQGTGFDSDIARMGEDEISRVEIDHAGIERFQDSLNAGNRCNFEGFVYMPMQKDVNDFKFNFTKFQSNEEFLRTADEVVPKHLKILVKRHPLYPVKYDISYSKRMIDITDWNLNKHQIYQKMEAMICINSTSILEALPYGKQVFAFGKDIYLNKGIVAFEVFDPAEFISVLKLGPNRDLCKRFVSLLLQRQVSRRRCVSNDHKYIDSHYWNQNL